MNLSELARKAFQTQLERMQLNLEGCIAGQDPIYLHDLRVANRRMRAALIDFQDLLPDPVFNTYRNDFRWIHRVTGTVRDLDIGLSYFPTYEKKIAKNWRDKLSPAKKLLEDKRQIAQEKLAIQLGSERVEGILNSWSGLLDEGVLEGSQSALEPAREYGCRKIVKRYQKVRKRGLKIGKKTPAEKYHGLRINVKKLRYLIGFFRPVLIQEEVPHLLSGLKGFQDALGGFQDAEVQILSLTQLGFELQASGSEVESVLALGQLIGIYEKEFRRSRKRSLTAIRWLVADGTAREFQSCFQYPVA
jgi:CHAD domain-containing protein